MCEQLFDYQLEPHWMVMGGFGATYVLSLCLNILIRQKHVHTHRIIEELDRGLIQMSNGDWSILILPHGVQAPTLVQLTDDTVLQGSTTENIRNSLLPNSWVLICQCIYHWMHFAWICFYQISDST